MRSSGFRVPSSGWRRTSLAGLLGLLLAAAPLRAQSAADSLVRPPSPVLVKYGKWALVAAAIGMGIQAANAHDDADRAFSRLTSYCDAKPGGCPQGGNGRYLDPAAERYYQQSVSADKRARNWLFGGEASLLGAAGLFVWELSRPRSLPRNIPFNPEIRWTPRETQLRGSVRF
ncbi:MAG TPA: hypothetical protein VG692_07165 [Gemmatimonadales bacterium]|nr:hypothetical protein [Gemmatimonadales bacterium]